MFSNTERRRHPDYNRNLAAMASTEDCVSTTKELFQLKALEPARIPIAGKRVDRESPVTADHLTMSTYENTLMLPWSLAAL
jgi:hypothetical protein